MPDQISLDDCEVTIESEEHFEYPDAFTYITVKVVHPEHGEVGYLKAIHIIPELCDDFLTIMDGESDELQKFALGVCDSSGKIQEKYITHPYHKGTGCFGEEMNAGTYIYITDIVVKREFRHQGIGTLAVRKLANYEEHVFPEDFLVMWPVPLNFELDNQQEWGAMKQIIDSFAASNGFRRIGRSNFLAYSADPTHPSRSLAAADDVPENNTYQQPAPEPDEEMIASHGEDQAREIAYTRDYPVHRAIKPLWLQLPRQYMMAPPAAIPARYRPPIFPPAPIENIIQQAYEQDRTLVRKKDHLGMTPLHVAAQTRDVAAIRALLNLPQDAGVRDNLNDYENANGASPVDICETAVNENKEFARVMLNNEALGALKDADRCIYLLKTAKGDDPWSPEEKARGVMNGKSEREKEDIYCQRRSRPLTAAQQALHEKVFGGGAYRLSRFGS